MLEVVAMIAAVAKAVPILAGLCDKLISILIKARAVTRRKRKDGDVDDAIDSLAAKPKRTLNPRTGRVE